MRQVSGEIQLIINTNEAFLMIGDQVLEIEKSVTFRPSMQNDDVLLPYVMEAVTTLEEGSDLTEVMAGDDIEGFLNVATNSDNSAGQRLNAYWKLGDCLHTIQPACTAAALKRELQKYTKQNSARLYQIAMRTKFLFDKIGMPYVKNFRNITPDWIYKLPKPEFNRFLQLCDAINEQVIDELWNANVWLQELPIEGGNVCGDTD